MKRLSLARRLTRGVEPAIRSGEGRRLRTTRAGSLHLRFLLYSLTEELAQCPVRGEVARAKKPPRSPPTSESPIQVRIRFPPAASLQTLGPSRDGRPVAADGAYPDRLLLREDAGESFEIRQALAVVIGISYA